MTGDRARVDMAGGADVLGILADFIAAHPGLPALVNVQVGWHYVDKAWQVTGQLTNGNTAGVAGWAEVLRDPVTSTEDGGSPYTGPYTRHEVTGLLRGHPVTVWACELREPEPA